MPQQGPPGSLVPGSFKSTISLGKRFVPAPAPGQAAWNEFLRGYALWGPIGVDPSPTGFAGGVPGRFGRALPYVGGAIGSSLAGEAARKQQGRMVEVPPRNRPMDVLDTLRNIFRFVPGMAGTLGSVGTGVAKGLTGWFQGHPDRTGMARGMDPSVAAWSGRQAPSPVGVDWSRGYPTTLPQASTNPFAHPDTGVLPAWAGGPSTWNQPAATWGLPIGDYRPFESP